MKQILMLALAILLTLSLLTTCGGNSGNNSGSSAPPASANSSKPSDSSSASSAPPDSANSGSNSSTPANTFTPPVRVVEVPDEPLDLSDDSIYFISIEGVKFNLIEITVKDLLAAGFYFDEDKEDEDYFDENTEVEPNNYIGSTFSGTELYKEGTKGYIYIMPVNLTDHAIPVKDCEISSLAFDNRSASAFDISTVCNLSVGCALEEVAGVFGEYEVTKEGKPILFFNEGFGMSGRAFTFTQDEDGKITNIVIETDKSVDWS